jgi:hypothetical protein
MVDAAREHDRVTQHGTQSRSDPSKQMAVAMHSAVETPARQVRAYSNSAALCDFAGSAFQLELSSIHLN